MSVKDSTSATLAPPAVEQPPGIESPPPAVEAGLIERPRTLREVTDDVARLVGRKPSRAWWVALTACGILAAIGFAAIIQTLLVGIGVWGLNRTVGWGFDITNFVFWIGIGHAGTLISAILFLLRQQWRTSISRAAEAMTIFAVLCAAIFPLLHMGRPWFAYWMVPLPNTLGPLWINFRSPLVWDVFAISTYFIISLVFWYIGMAPDMATLRDRATTKTRRLVYGLLALGWNGSARTWHRYEAVYALLALLATPLVVSVHSIVSFDFATSVIPGWHTTIFPPYFVVGAVFAGFAMVLALLLITRKLLHLENYITPVHMNWMCKVMLIGSIVIGSAYAIEFFIAWYSGNEPEYYAFLNRATGPYAWAYWTMVTCNVLIPQLLWLRKARRSAAAMFFVCVSITIGMWFERFVIIVTSLHRDFLPSSWTMYTPTANELAILAGTFGIFFGLFLLFTRFLPIVPIAEMKAVLAPPHHPEEEHAPAAALANGNGRGIPAGGPLRRLRGLVSRNGAGANGNGGEHTWIGYFTEEETLLRAVREARRQRLPIADAFTPYPVHALPAALGLKASRLTWVGFWAGATALAGALLLQAWTSAIDWPVRVGGQPFASWPLFGPVTFEVTVLTAGLVGVAALFAAARLWPRRHTRALPGVTDDRFALAIRQPDASVDPDAVRRLLEECGAVEISEGDERVSG